MFGSLPTEFGLLLPKSKSPEPEKTGSGPSLYLPEQVKYGKGYSFTMRSVATEIPSVTETKYIPAAKLLTLMVTVFTPSWASTC